jgi:thiamine biosynthesis lipoprotein ApbE
LIDKQPRRHRDRSRRTGAVSSFQASLLLRASSIDADAWATRLVHPGDAEEERLE